MQIFDDIFKRAFQVKLFQGVGEGEYSVHGGAGGRGARRNVYLIGGIVNLVN